MLGDKPDKIHRISATLTFKDRLGAWKVRWGIGRMYYRIKPGLYRIGDPTPESPMLVSANYKLSFDHLRSKLLGIDAWILVLDTRGVNVWCSAGKGTFSTDELVERIKVTGLREVVKHKKLILPQLSATGVAAHKVKELSGFKVKYGPVRAEDLPAYLVSGMRATPEMRRVRFPLRSRLVLIPYDLVMSAKYLLLTAICFFALSGLNSEGYFVAQAVSVGLRSVLLLLCGYIAGAVITPVFLPYVPGRSFSAKGAWVGFALVLVLLVWKKSYALVFDDWLSASAWLLIIPAIASFIAMNFTGSSTFTSLSGVRREMRVAVPLQIVGSVAGIGLWITSRFI